MVVLPVSQGRQQLCVVSAFVGSVVVGVVVVGSVVVGVGVVGVGTGTGNGIGSSAGNGVGNDVGNDVCDSVGDSISSVLVLSLPPPSPLNLRLVSDRRGVCDSIGGGRRGSCRSCGAQWLWVRALCRAAAARQARRRSHHSFRGGGCPHVQRRRGRQRGRSPSCMYVPRRGSSSGSVPRASAPAATRPPLDCPLRYQVKFATM